MNKYKMEFKAEGVTLYFRLLNIGEYNSIRKKYLTSKQHPYFIYEEIFNLCGLNTNLSQNVPIGCIISCGEYILHLCSETTPDKLLFDIAAVRKENPVDSLNEHMRSVIMMVFSSYKLKELNEMTRDEFIETFVIAENIATKMNPGFQRLDLYKIYEEQIEKKEKPPIVNDVPYQNENKELEQALGYWNLEDAKTLYEEEKKQARLSKAQLEKLDKR